MLFISDQRSHNVKEEEKGRTELCQTNIVAIFGRPALGGRPERSK
jgi:hypothetical protein